MRDARWKLIFGIATVVGWVAVAQAASASESLSVKRDASHVSVYDGKRVVLRYRHSGAPMKPYADQLFSPAGVQILRDSPQDHVHHHGLMYAVTIDGVNFWEEVGGKFGRQVPRSLRERPAAVVQDAEIAGFVEELDWVKPGEKTPLLLERRQVEVVKGANLDATLVEWRCRLETPPDKKSLQLTGKHYHGLGMRFVASMDRDGRFFNADNKPGKVVRGTEKLTPTRWCAYTAKADGKPVTVALLDHPENLRHPAHMFTMTKTFAYLAATLNEWQEPVIIAAGKPLELCYAVAVWDGETDAGTIERLYQRWLKMTATQQEQFP